MGITDCMPYTLVANVTSPFYTIHTYVHTHIHTYIHTYIHTFKYIHTVAYIRIYTHIHTRTHELDHRRIRHWAFTHYLAAWRRLCTGIHSEDHTAHHSVRTGIRPAAIGLNVISVSCPNTTVTLSKHNCNDDG
jgi:hypothetical protein